jgi:glycosyltransferase involved in cell wall biosynthesis
MKLLVSIDEHYVTDGVNVFTTQGTTPYKFFWSEYLQVFDYVYILARVREDRSFPGQQEAVANGTNVEFIPLPDFHGPFQYFPLRNKVRACIRQAIPKADVFFLRGPGIIGGFVARELERQGKLYATQVIGDLWEVFGAGQAGGVLRPIYQRVLTRDVQRICRNAIGTAYVTKETLQRRYPASPGAAVAAWSDVQIGDALASLEELEKRTYSICGLGDRPAILGFIGSFEQPYKGADVLLEAVKICRAKGVEVEARLVGDGRLLGEYKQLATQLGLAEHATFPGRLGAGGPIFKFLDAVDLFVMPSLTEGLPRAMIEAMARGCPCIGSSVGGIPELLDATDLVKPADASALAEKIMEKVSSPTGMIDSARRNHDAAREYMPDQAQAKRFAFLHAIRNRVSMSKSSALPKPKHLALIVTVPLSTPFFRGQIARLCEAGFRVTLICSPGPQTEDMKAEGAEVITVPMAREIAGVKDVVSLWRLWRVLRRSRPDVTNVGTPKAGLLGGIAARLAGVPHRVYTLHGLRLETAKGLKRHLLTAMERASCVNAQHVRCVGPALLQRAVSLKLVKEDKAYVIGQGSANGIDCAYFRRTPERVAQAQELRRQFNIPGWAPVIGFAGRLTRDKGINELYRAFLEVKKTFPDVRLLLLGDFEGGDPVDAAVREGLKTDPNAILPGSVSDIAPYYAVMDVFALPSYREGFPTVSLEAQAACIPVVTTRVTGAAESVLDGVTGLLVPAGDTEALARALRELVEHPEYRRRMGEAGAAWVEDRFRQEVVWQALIEDYERITKKPETSIEQSRAKKVFGA